MLTPTNELVSVLINGQVHQQWQGYDIESDLMTPADAWYVTIGLDKQTLPSFVAPWAEVVIKVGDEVVMHGRVDQVLSNLDKTRNELSLSGRDLAGVLLDCAAPIFATRQSTLSEIIAKVVRPLGLQKFKIDADSTRTREKINVEPGDRAWDVLQHVAEANGLWPWFAPDGTLIVGGPDYSAPPVARLFLKRNGETNVESLDVDRNCNSQFSSVTVLGQTHSTELELGKHALKATATDNAVSFNRPQMVIDHECDSTAIALDRARKLLADSQLSSLTIHAKVTGHRTESGALWAPGQRVHILSEPHGLNGLYFLMARRFTGGRGQATCTDLTFKPDGVWLLDAHPHKRKHRRGKNHIGEIISTVGESS